MELSYSEKNVCAKLMFSGVIFNMIYFILFTQNCLYKKCQFKKNVDITKQVFARKSYVSSVQALWHFTFKSKFSSLQIKE